MSPYEIFLRDEAVRALGGVRARDRRLITAFIDSLAENPFAEGDYPMRDATQREIQIKIIGAFAVTFWSDHAVREVRIIDIRKTVGA